MAICGPLKSNDEIPLEPASVEYRLEKAWLAGYGYAQKIQIQLKALRLKVGGFNLRMGNE
jgi:hypothetical protein